MRRFQAWMQRYGFEHWYNLCGMLMIVIPLVLVTLFVAAIMFWSAPLVALIIAWIVTAFILWFFKNGRV